MFIMYTEKNTIDIFINPVIIEYGNKSSSMEETTNFCLDCDPILKTRSDKLTVKHLNEITVESISEPSYTISTFKDGYAHAVSHMIEQLNGIYIYS